MRERFLYKSPEPLGERTGIIYNGADAKADALFGDTAGGALYNEVRATPYAT
jgi:hypothetical protein